MLLVGTKNGLFALSSGDRKAWTLEATGLQGTRVFNAVLDQRNAARLFAADNGDFFGAHLRYSDDYGRTWSEPATGLQFPADSGRKLNNVWVIVPGRADQPGTVFAGVDPASLWRSDDNGATWELVQGLENHPTREQWNPGAGGLCLHSIVPDHSRPERMWVAISAVGCLQTDDGGESWSFKNRGVRAEFSPERYPEFGQCVHRLLQHPTRPDTLYQQNHCGVYRSDSAGEQWQEITGELPSDFGFPFALDSHNPDTVFVIVERFGTHSQEPLGRHNVGDQFAVYRSTDGGNEWRPLTGGLPRGTGVRLGVLRHAMCTDTEDPCGVYVGTKTGQLFASADRGENWDLIADYLPPIYSVTATLAL